jgi:prepilin-type N-terminal cleavage/methylation domain-containing protein
LNLLTSARLGMRGTQPAAIPRLASRGGHHRGFTLIEVAVVLLVLALAVGIALPSIGRTSDAIRARADVASVAAFLRYAREQAIARREVHEVGLAPDARTLVLIAGDRKDVKASREIRFPTRIALESPGLRSVTFMPEGRSSGGAFLVEAPGRRLYRVSVDPLSGRINNRRVES